MADEDLGSGYAGFYFSPGAYRLSVTEAFSGVNKAQFSLGGVAGAAVSSDEDSVVIELELSQPELKGTDNLSGRPGVKLGLTGTLSLSLPPVVPPAGLAPLYIRRRSPIMPTVVGRNARGEPIT